MILFEQIIHHLRASSGELRRLHEEHAMPPVGAAPFVTTSIAKVKIGQTVREMLPFHGVTLVVLMLMNYVPG